MESAMQHWRLLDTPPMTAAANMAMDEALVELKGEGKSHVIGEIFAVFGDNDVADIPAIGNPAPVVDRILPRHPAQN